MRPIDLKLFTLALLALLAGLYFFVFEGGAVGVEQNLEVLGANREPGANTSLDSARVVAHSGAVPSGEREALRREALESESAPVAAAEVDLSLRGLVLGKSGTPLVGARVLVEADRGWVHLPLDAEEVHALRGWRKVEETLTDAEGRFAFLDLASATYVLEVHDAEHEPLRLEDLGYQSLEGLDLGEITLVPGAMLRGRVLDNRGVGVASAQLLESLGRGETDRAVRIPGRGRLLGETDTSGNFRLASLAPGTLRLIVDSSEHLPTEVEAEAIEQGGPERELVVYLEPGFAVQGKVEGVPSEALARLRVIARLSDSAGQEFGPSQEEIPPVATRPRTVACDGTGRFEIHGLAAGKRYRLTAFELNDNEEQSLQRLPEIDPVYARPGDTDVVLGLKKSSALRFRVVDDETGASVTHFAAMAGFERTTPLKEHGETKLEHPGGLVRFVDLRQTDEVTTAKVVILGVGYEEFTKSEIALEEGEELDLGELRLKPAPRLTVRVTDAATGRPVSGAYVVTGTSEWSANLRTRAESKARGAREEAILFFEEKVNGGPVDANGVAELRPLLDGSSVVIVAAEGYAPYQSDVQEFAGEVDLNWSVELVRGGEVEVQVRDSLGRGVEGLHVIPYRFRENQPGNEWTRLEAAWKSDASGNVRFEFLPAGEHGFRIVEDSERSFQGYVNLTPDQSWQRVAVENGKVHELELLTDCRSSLTGSVRESGLALAGASLTLVTLENGEPVEERGNTRYFGSSSEAPNRAETDENGMFRFDCIKSGEYLVRVSHETRYMTSETPVTVQVEPTHLDLNLSVASIEGRITDSDGMAIEGIRVHANTASGGRRENWNGGGMQLSETEEGETTFKVSSGSTITSSAEAVSDSTGRFEIRGVRAEEKISLSISDALYSVVSRDLTSLGGDEVRRDVDFVLEGAGAIQLSLTWSSGQTVDRIRVHAEYLDAGEQASETRNQTVRRWRPQADFKSLRPGRWKLKLSGEQDVLLRTVEVIVRVGETTNLTIELQ